MSMTIEVMNASQDASVPTREEFTNWSEIALAALHLDDNSYELSIRLVDEAESSLLNENYRKKKGPTNVLSFRVDQSSGLPDMTLLGDLAICTRLVKQEAKAQNKSETAHWAHLTVHGLLHLLGYDHDNENAAVEMEAMEIRIMQTIGFNDPYQQTQ